MFNNKLNKYLCFVWWSPLPVPWEVRGMQRKSIQLQGQLVFALNLKGF